MPHLRHHPFRGWPTFWNFQDSPNSNPSSQGNTCQSWGNGGTSVKGHIPTPPPSFYVSFSHQWEICSESFSYKIKQNYKVNLLGGKKKGNKTPRPPYNTFQPQIEMAERSSLFYLSVTSSVSLSSLSCSLSPPLLSPEAAREEEHLSLSWSAGTEGKAKELFQSCSKCKRGFFTARLPPF